MSESIEFVISELASAVKSECAAYAETNALTAR